MARVNAKILTLKHELFKRLKDSLEKDKDAIKSGAEIAYKDYCKIDIKHVPTEVDNKVEDIFNMLKDSNDKVITKTANIMVNKAASKK